MEFLITIDQFNGPLDLMLHLIKENKLDLFDLNINELATQYITYILSMQDMNLEIASEYLVQLAYLIEYKSKKLLPNVQVELEDNYEEDNQDELVKRLIEYQKFKEVSQEFNELYEQRQKMITKPYTQLLDEFENIERPLANMDVTYLIKAMNNCIKRKNIINPFEVKVTQKELSIFDRISQIKSKMIKLPSIFSFDDLCEDCQSMNLYILTFLSILDMIRQQELYYEIMNEQIYFRRGANE
ncbi:MAG: segregation/condensation protein A [Erysipelotrichaceae bacterium]